MCILGLVFNDSWVSSEMKNRVYKINIKGSRFIAGLFYMTTNLNTPLNLDTFWLNLDDFEDLC